ncbi:CDP-alcohol phosphatidyltransferase family protein [Thioalkalivibrio sp.]|uniref:CDP-alcohol phosphatidyltransferase family protein n=1 Tax=Thioalkalivibrio sp. TaxID=2093813 RepID=UPI00356B5128
MDRSSECALATAERESGVPRTRGGWRAALSGQVRAWRVELTLGLAVVIALSLPLALFAGLTAGFVATAMLLFLALSLLVLFTAPAEFRTMGPGPGNRVTFLRAAMVVPVAAMVFHPSLQQTASVYALFGVAVLALILDGADGALARRFGRVTAFGARFDMELDALLILALSVLVWQTGKTGPWVLLIGVMRYGFVASGWYWRWLQGALPPSRRRQSLCVVQSVALLIALAPPVPPAIAVVVSLGALVLLVYSFVMDILWLHRHRETGPRDGA